MKDWAKYIFVQAFWFGKGRFTFEVIQSAEHVTKAENKQLWTTGLSPLISPVKMKMFLYKGS